MSSDTAATALALDVVIGEDDGGGTVRVYAGRRDYGSVTRLAALCLEDPQSVRVTLSADGVLAELLATPDAADALDRTLALPPESVGGWVLASAMRRTIMQAVTAVIPQEPSRNQIALHAAIERCVDDMLQETP